jgi:hypothetical protein
MEDPQMLFDPGGLEKDARVVTHFSADMVEDLRTRARAVSRALPDLPNGWSKSPFDPVQILNVFTSLRLKTGLALHAYLFTSGGDGYGVVWALPMGKEPPDPDRRPKFLRRFLGPFKPFSALRDFMGAVEGDGTPLSYLSASIAARELAEFGARWHLQTWNTMIILDRDPWIEPPHPDDFLDFRQSRSWKLHISKPEPDDWKPRVELGQDSATVTFMTYSGHIEHKITRHTDRFSTGTYVFKTETSTLATGSRGYIF